MRKIGLFIISLYISIFFITSASAATITAQQHLATYDVSINVARNFIMSNLENLGTVYTTCLFYGVNNDMIAEILANDFPGLTGQVVSSYFDDHGFHGNSLGFNSIETVDTTLDDVSYKNEPYYKYQWHIDSSTYQAQNLAFQNALSGYVIGDVDADADINVVEAWKSSRGADVYVAVIDDGVDVNHEDIKDNLYLAYNADDKSSDVSNKNTDQDIASHGNTCAGFITSSINGKGTVGVAPSSKLIAIKLGSSLDSTTIEAFEYAKNNGAKVISCSWGTEHVSDAIVAELKSLYDAGITVLFASGNDHKSLDTTGLYDESEVEWVIGVGSSAENNDVAEAYSNYGSNIDIIAPGGDASNSIGILGLDDSGTQGSKDNYGLVSNSYSFGNGTSYATPVAAGVVALMYSVNPHITPKQVKEILISTTDKVGGTKANYINNSLTNQTFDEQRAYGKINAGHAVAAAKALNN